MRWFKHYNDAVDSESLSLLIEKFGFEGYGRYWTLLEFLSQKFDGEAHIFRIHRSSLRRLLAIRSWNELDSFLDHIGTIRGMDVKRIENVYEMNCSILLELQGRDFKKARSEREGTAPKIKIKNKKKIKNNTNTSSEVETTLVATKTSIDSDAKDLNKQIWEAYKTGYEEKYGIEPVRNAMVNGVVSNLGKRLGKDAIEVVKFYLQHPSEFYLKTCHALKNCLHDAESLRTQLHHRKPLTERRVREFSKKLDDEVKFREMTQRFRQQDEEEQHKQLLEIGEGT